jgi:RimJ/RimL family protein N-acetyltransferase
MVFSLAPNQHPVCAQLDRAGLSYYAGEFSAFNSESFVEAFEKFTGSLDQRAQALKLSRGVIDCLGAKRIAEFLAPSSTSELISRRAAEEDFLTYFGWVNDPIVRSQSLTSSRVELSDHERWFSERLKDPAYRLFVYEVNALPIAQVRFEQIGENWEISYSLDELVRGRGWGVPVIKMAVQSLLVEVNAPLVIAKVKESNTASKKALLNSGFTDTGASNSDGVLILHLNTAKVQPSC